MPNECHKPETAGTRSGVAFQFSNITVTDYEIMDQDQAMFLKRKYPLFNIFYVQNLF